MTLEWAFFFVCLINSFLIGLAQAFYRHMKRWEREAWRKTRMCAWYQCKLADLRGETVPEWQREFARYGRLEDQE